MHYASIEIKIKPLKIEDLAAILVPVAFFLSVLSPNATEPNALIYLAYLGAIVLATGLITLGVGLIRRPAP